ncbi:hypothetical protein ACQYAD_09685 [Neobacillus sp. SM06]|uniref:hypothetical protein n=1 Tax=Neobacillus sp. SM06 TaxID=3422492 RepID=UPI003D2AAF36
MKKLEWSDEQLEALLRQMPKLQDRRKQQEIYQCLTLKMTRRKKIVWLLPSTVALGAFLLFLLLAPYLDNDQSKLESHLKIASLTATSRFSNLSFDHDQLAQMGAKALGTNERLPVSDGKTAVYQKDIGSGKVLTYWIPDQQAKILVPVSTVVLHLGRKTRLELFTEKMQRLREQEWGLREYYPIHANLKQDKQSSSVLINVPAASPYKLESDAETGFVHAMIRNVDSNSNMKKITITANDRSGNLLDNNEKKSEMIVGHERNRAYFFYFPAGKKVPFLVPSVKSYPDIKSAFEAMGKDNARLRLRASIPPGLKVSFFMMKNKTLYLTVSGHDPLKNTAEAIYSYEAILLTAKDFGMERVKLENPNLKHLGPFDLTKENHVPVAANLRQIED